MLSTLLFLMASLSLANDRADAVAGHYVLRGVMEVGSELLLKPDGTFEYYLSDAAADYWAKGTWKQVQNRVVLNPSGKEQPPFRLVDGSSTREPGTRIWVKNSNGRPVEHIDVVLRTPSGETEARTDS